MKKLTHRSLPLLLLAISLFSCKKSEPNKPDLDCITNFVLMNNFIPYSGQVFMDCTDMILLYEYEGKDYFVHDNNCADMIAIPIDCDNMLLCQSYDDPIWSDFFRNAVYQRIVGYN